MNRDGIIMLLLIAFIIFLIYNTKNYENFLTETEARESKRLADIEAANAKSKYDAAVLDAANKTEILKQRTKEASEAIQMYEAAKAKADATAAELEQLNAENARRSISI
jgi:YbbR domain-containing protein